MRGVDATVKFATAAPDGVKRSSGSAVRFPTTVMVVSPATSSSWVLFALPLPFGWEVPPRVRGALAVCAKLGRRRAYAAAPTDRHPLVLVSACRSAAPWSAAPTRSG